MKTDGKNSVLFTFLSITVFYLFTRWVIFQGFNGTDDLHYAFLASRMINHTFSPFVHNDIFSGRLLLISIQALIYKIAGINIISTQAGTILVTILTCYLVLFRLLSVDHPLHVILGSFLFYFNPALTGSTIGILPDAYIMLIGLCVGLLLKKIIFGHQQKKEVLYSFLIGLIIGLSLFIKETAVLFVPFSCLLFFIYQRGRYILQTCLLLFGFSTIVLLTGIYYHFNTGNALFKISQIETSDYKYLPNYHIEKSILLIRLTIGPWQTFVGQGFYPVVIAAGILITKCFSKGTKFLIYQFYPLAFFILLLIGLYFPFSISPFHPLKSECRQFLFLLPWAAAICTNYLYILFRPTQKNDKLFWIFPVLLVCCMMSTRNKWEWMIYLLTTILFSFRYILEMKRSFSIYLISSIFFLSVLEIIFFNFSPWFSEMQVLEKRIPDNCFYFADHDNMMHYELLRKFDFKKSSFFNLEKDPFFILDNYTSSPNDHPFKPGWLICNRAYTIRSGKFFSEIDSLTSLNLFSRTIKFPHINAYFIEDRKKLNIIQRLVLLDQ